MAKTKMSSLLTYQSYVIMLINHSKKKPCFKIWSKRIIASSGHFHTKISIENRCIVNLPKYSDVFTEFYKQAVKVVGKSCWKMPNNISRVRHANCIWIHYIIYLRSTIISIPYINLG